jgi:superfamily II DNA/RNA helicase
MFASQSLTPRSPASLETLHNILGSLVARYRHEEVVTAVRQIPAREAKFRPMPAWVTSALAEAYQAKGVRELYSHQASTAELVRDGKNVVVVTPTASGKTLCYNLPILNAVLENPDTRALHGRQRKSLKVTSGQEFWAFLRAEKRPDTLKSSRQFRADAY